MVVDVESKVNCGDDLYGGDVNNNDNGDIDDDDGIDPNIGNDVTVVMAIAKLAVVKIQLVMIVIGMLMVTLMIIVVVLVVTMIIVMVEALIL